MAGDTGVEVEVVGRAAASGGDLGIVGVFRPNPVAVVAEVAPGRQKGRERVIKSPNQYFQYKSSYSIDTSVNGPLPWNSHFSSQHPENTCYLTERT